jgi:hypothetical protein
VSKKRSKASRLVTLREYVPPRPRSKLGPKLSKALTGPGWIACPGCGLTLRVEQLEAHRASRPGGSYCLRRRPISRLSKSQFKIRMGANTLEGEVRGANNSKKEPCPKCGQRLKIEYLEWHVESCRPEPNPEEMNRRTRRRRSESVRTVSGGAFESSRRRH